MEHFRGIRQIAEAEIDHLVDIPDIGRVMAESLFLYFRNNENKEMLNSLEKSGLKFTESTNLDLAKATPFTGAKCVLTGKLAEITRTEAEELLIKLGANVVSNVSAQTNFLIMGENPGSKLSKARENNVKVLSEKEFLAMVKES